MFVSSTHWTLLSLIFFGSLSLTARDANCSPDLNIIKTIFLDAEDIRHPLILEEGNYELVLRNMIPAAEYSLFLNVDKYRYDCHPKVELVDPRIKLHRLNEEVFSFHSIESVTKLLLTNPNCIGDLPLTLSVGLINEPEQPVENTTKMMGLFTSTTQYTAEQLIEDVFIGGDCFSVEPGSIQYSGAVTSVGYFSEGDSSIKLEEGVMLSTGRVDDSAGPNSRYNRGTWATGINNDPDLMEIIDNSFFSV